MKNTQFNPSFEAFKPEFIQRCKDKSACTNEFKRVVASTTLAELLTIIKDNMQWCLNNSTISREELVSFPTADLHEAGIYFDWKGQVKNSTIEAWGNSTVTAWDNSTVTARGNSTVTACRNSTVTAWDNSTVTAWGNSTITAWDNSTVEARGNSTVEARGNSTVTACRNSTVTAWDNSTVTARGNSTVTACRNSTVTAWDNSTVTAWGNSTVTAWDNSTVYFYGAKDKMPIPNDSSIIREMDWRKGTIQIFVKKSAFKIIEL